MQPINSALITLIPKINSLETAANYRPISLVSMPIKIITKLLANMLQKDIIPILSRNQYGFKKTGIYMVVYLGHMSICTFVTNQKRKSSFSKLILKKTFDKGEHNAIISCSNTLHLEKCGLDGSRKS